MHCITAAWNEEHKFFHPKNSFLNFSSLRFVCIQHSHTLSTPCKNSVSANVNISLALDRAEFTVQTLCVRVKEGMECNLKCIFASATEMNVRRSRRVFIRILTHMGKEGGNVSSGRENVDYPMNWIMLDNSSLCENLLPEALKHAVLSIDTICGKLRWAPVEPCQSIVSILALHTATQNYCQ